MCIFWTYYFFAKPNFYSQDDLIIILGVPDLKIFIEISDRPFRGLLDPKSSIHLFCVLGLNVVVIQVRMPMTAQDNSPHLKTLWTTLKLYTIVMDYLILKYKISAGVRSLVTFNQKYYGWMQALQFYILLTVFQFDQDDGRVLMKGCTQWNLVYGLKDFFFQWELILGLLD